MTTGEMPSPRTPPLAMNVKKEKMRRRLERNRGSRRRRSGRPSERVMSTLRCGRAAGRQVVPPRKGPSSPPAAPGRGVGRGGHARGLDEDLGIAGAAAPVTTVGLRPGRGRGPAARGLEARLWWGAAGLCLWPPWAPGSQRPTPTSQEGLTLLSPSLWEEF